MRLRLLPLVSLPLWLALALALALSACGGGGGNPLPTGPTPVSADVEFELVTSQAVESPSSTSTSTSTNLADCAGLVRLHPSWWSFAQVTMVATAPDTYGLYFDQVPIGAHKVRLTVPEGCGGARLRANGATLEAGEDGGFAFMVHSDGRITP